MKKFVIHFVIRPLCLFILLGFICSAKLYAQNDLLIFPKRLVFDGVQQRVKSLNLQNITNDTITYRISHVEMGMNNDGSLAALRDSVPDNSAIPYLRVYPRTVTLAPRETQLIKVQLIKTGSLAEAEYRSHLYMRRVPKENKSKKTSGNSDDLQINLTPVYGITIPNIITIGKTDTVLSISNAVLEQKESGALLSFDIKRQGNYSSYGDIEVNHITDDGKSTSIAALRGVAVYTPLEERHIVMNIPGVPHNNKGKLEIIYRSSDGIDKKPFAAFSLKL